MCFLPPEGGSHDSLEGIRLNAEAATLVGARVRVMISCGEPSGDMYAAELARRIRACEPAAVITGFGGERLPPRAPICSATSADCR